MIWLLYYKGIYFSKPYSELNPVKSPLRKGKSWKLLLYIIYFLLTVRNIAEASNQM